MIGSRQRQRFETRAAEGPAAIALVLCMALILFGASSCGPRATVKTEAPPPTSADLALTHVNVVAMDSEAILADHAVLIENGRVVAVVPSAGLKLSAETEVVDGGGGYVIPGLADMHVHVWNDYELPLFVAHGVTFVRNMWGSDDTLKLRERVRSDDVLGPEIVTTGPIIDGPPVIWPGSAQAATPDEGRALVDAHVEKGYDFIKVYSNLSPDTFEAIAARAREKKIPFVGHVPRAVPLASALASGMSSIEHLEGFRPATFADDGPVKPGPPNWPVIFEALGEIARGERAWSSMFSPEKRVAAAELTAKHGVWNVPTLVLTRYLFTPRSAVAAQLKRPEMRWMHPSRVARWNPDADFRLSRMTDEQITLIGTSLAEQKRQVMDLHRAGARLLVGTDTANPFVVNGVSVHEELALLVDCGLSPYDALVAATRGPAEFLGLEDQRGTIASGKIADLVLVRRNPLEDISASREIVGVVLRGRWRPISELHQHLDDVAATFPAPSEAPTSPTGSD